MMIKAVILFLLFIIVLALISGPGFRRFLMLFLGIGRSGR